MSEQWPGRRRICLTCLGRHAREQAQGESAVGILRDNTVESAELFLGRYTRPVRLISLSKCVCLQQLYIHTPVIIFCTIYIYFSLGIFHRKALYPKTLAIDAVCAKNKNHIVSTFFEMSTTSFARSAILFENLKSSVLLLITIIIFGSYIPT